MADETDNAKAGEDVGGSYEVIRARLVEQARELGKRANALNLQRVDAFGGSDGVVREPEGKNRLDVEGGGLVEHPDKIAEQPGDAARALAQERLDWGSFAQAVESVLDTV